MMHDANPPASKHILHEYLQALASSDRVSLTCKDAIGHKQDFKVVSD